MNKITKGTLAGAAAVALLVAGGTTLAFWNDSVDLGGPTTISAGTLELAQVSAPTWQIQHVGGALSPVADIDEVRIVPGDTLVYTGSYEVTAQGQNLAFIPSVTEGSIIASAGGDPADEALATRLAQSATYTINGAPFTGTAVTIDHSNNASTTYPVEISVNLAWPFGVDSVADNPAKLGSVSLSNFSVQVTQVSP